MVWVGTQRQIMPQKKKFNFRRLWVKEPRDSVRNHVRRKPVTTACPVAGK